MALLLFSGVVVGKPVAEESFGAWVPEGWTLLQQAVGDLDNDSRPDVVLVLEEANPLNRKRNDSMGPAELNLNPRRLLVLLNGETGYRPVLSVDHFLPSEGDEQTPCLDDPLGMGGVKVDEGLLEISLEYWLSCGSYVVDNHFFTFRYEEDRFRLIGVHISSFTRSSGELEERSIDFLTDARDPLYIDSMSLSCPASGTVQSWCE